MTLDINSLENWLWDAACVIRGEIDAPKYKDYILPLIFLKRISDVYEDEIKKLAKELGSEDIAEEIANEDHNVVSFYLPTEARWKEFRKITVGIGEYLTKAVRSIAKENTRLNGVIDIVDYNATSAGQRIINDDKLVALIDVLSKHRIGLEDTQPDIIGRAYEYMLRKFAEGSGSSAGEFYTPPEVSILMAHIIDPEPGNTIYDPCCGSAGLLIKSYLRFKEKYPDSYEKEGIRFYGQEINHLTYAMSKMNSFIYKMDIDIVLGDTLNRPAFKTKGGALQQFDKLVANPMWNQKFPEEVYEKDSYGRFTFGYPPNNTADWGWVQHMYASINNNGKMAVVLDTGAVSRGSGNVGTNKERDIRKEFVEKDLIEAAILLPENMFYNTSAPGIILIINKNKKKKNEILLINATKLFTKGKPKNYLTEDAIKSISKVYSSWKEEEGISKIITKEICSQNDYNLSPSRFVTQNNDENILSLEDAVLQLKEIEIERKKSDEKLNMILKKLGY
ncbi:MAG: SAM-dependent DNA methyltransferase [Candidatus Heimdallarchaeota archaeon]|nr:SAM-dependent DNA methyltransferase [Candidatus Heimdallarchaeota archaeon]